MKPTRPEYRDHVAASFYPASVREYARGLVVVVDPQTIDALVTDAQGRGLVIAWEYVAREIGGIPRAEARIHGFRRRRTVGRPPLPRGVRRVAISIRMTPDVLRDVRARAKADGVPYQSWIQRVLVEKLDAANGGPAHVR
jgi:uncharacterized protein (DUF4415 family)